MAIMVSSVQNVHVHSRLVLSSVSIYNITATEARNRWRFTSTSRTTERRPKVEMRASGFTDAVRRHGRKMMQRSDK